MSQHVRTGSYIPPSSAPNVIPRKRNLSASAIPLRPPPALRTTPQPPPAEDEDEEADGKDDYGDIEVNNGESRDETLKEERERLKYCPFCVLEIGGAGTDFRVLLETFTPEQMQRYEVFRRANLNKGSIKKVLPSSSSHNPRICLRSLCP
jgi:hTAFII28-like protein conserved region